VYFFLGAKSLEAAIVIAASNLTVIPKFKDAVFWLGIQQAK
jgi:hypothetical protein